jgi:pimeloyl-ACP methyl ester carboxylesterase
MKLFYREFGSGQPLILLHGLFGSSDNWVTFARTLADACNIKIFVPDLRNHGQSPQHPVFSFEALTDDLFEFIDTNNLSNPIVLGHSLGGKIILKALVEQPRFCKKAIIVDMGLRNYKPRYGHVEILELMQNNDLSEFASRKEVENLVSNHISDKRLQSFVLKNVYWKNSETLDWKINVESIGNYLPEIFTGISFKNPMNVETWFLKGALSDYINHEDIELIKTQFTNVHFEEIKNAGHWVHVDNPKDFFATILKAINQV